LKVLLPHVNYFGKRGSFFQLLDSPEWARKLPEGFVVLTGVSVNGNEVTGQVPAPLPLGIIQMMDDWGPNLTFTKLNIYSDEDIRLGRDRIRMGVILPYRLMRSSRSFSYYERI
jgi:hypothetical protein